MPGHAGRVIQVQHRIAAGAELHSLVAARQEARAPQARQQALSSRPLAGYRVQHYEGWQVAVGAAETVVHPRAHARAARQLAAGLKERDRRIVIDRFGMHRADQADVVDNRRRMRHQFAQGNPALPMSLERVLRGHGLKARLMGDHPGHALPLEHRFWNVLAKAILQQRLVVEQVQVRRTAGLEQEDDPLRLGREVRKRRSCRTLLSA